MTYSNAFLGAVNHIDMVSGQDLALAGAKVSARSISIDAGRDLILASQQNQYTADGRSFSLSLTLSPTGLCGRSQFYKCYPPSLWFGPGRSKDF